MGPNKNSELFVSTTDKSVNNVGAEFTRRNLVTPTLDELSSLFDGYEHTPSPLTDPTLLLKLHALAQVQMSQLGIAGFDPSRAVNFDQRAVRVTANAAPHHDEYQDPIHGTILTRVCKLEIPDSDYSDLIEVFALNIFSPDGDADAITADPQEAPKNSLIIVGKHNKIAGKTTPITGEVVALAVRNKETGDAKLYRVTIRSASQAVLMPPDGVEYEEDNVCRIMLPGGQSAEIEVLTGQLQQQMVNELNASAAAIKAVPKASLSDAERAALADI